MFAIFKQQRVVMILGLIVLVLLIWFFGDYFTALAAPQSRIAGMTGVVALFAFWQLFKTTRANQANNRLAAAVVDQAKGDNRPSADVVQLRERFEEAVATLKQQKKRGGLGLYELPWYVIIGAPGSGKTTALKYSGLKFPLEQRSGRGALRGVGGTRNCDWWFTEEAVLLDTAGRYTTQDSDASADSAGWTEFLTLLKKYRKRRPLNGVLLAISAQDLMTQGQSGREAHVAAARRRLNELNKELRIQLPVYVLVTKCDLLAGFSEYFDDMSQDDRAQVLGVTFPQEVTLKGEAANQFPAEFDAVVQRLNERVYTRLEDERDGRRRAKIFGFPQQMASLREGLTEFIADVFESTRFDQRVLLRGVYFTSGTQEGTPIDRLLGALGRRLAVSAEAVAPVGQGKAYFLERLLKQVVLAESGLAGVSRRLELQKAAAQFGLYIGMLLLGAFLLLMLTLSYRTNGSFLETFKAKVIETGRSIPPPGDSAVTSRPRLDRIRALVDDARAYGQTSWIRRGWGLDQSGPMETAAGDLYREELNQALVATVRTRIEQRLEALIAGGDPLDLYESLRAYLMLKDTKASHFRQEEVRDVARREWAAIYKGREEEVRQLDDHFGQLLESGLPGSPVNEDLITRARRAIPDDAAPRLILARVKRIYDEKHPRTAPLFANPLFRDARGRPVGEDVPGIFTEPGFRAAKDGLIKETATQFSSEKWVWEGDPPKQNSREDDVWQRYETQYIEQWDRVLKDVGVAAAPGGAALIDFINRVANEREGLKDFLLTIDRNTYLVPAPEEKNQTSWFGSIGAWIDSQWSSLRGKTTEPGARITYQFAPIHLLVTPIGGKPAALDDILARLKDVGAKLNTMKPGVVGSGVSGAGAAGVAQAADQLKQSASGFPGAAGNISNLIAGLGSAAAKTSGGQLAETIRVQYQNVLSQCHALINNRYPFVPTASADVTPSDLEKLFGASGAFVTFAENDLRDYVEMRGGQYVAKQMPDGSSLGIGEVVDKINAARRIREGFFPKGQASFLFDVKAKDLDAATDRFELDGLLFSDGQRLVYAHQGTSMRRAEWPTKPGELTARFFVDRTNRGPSFRGGDGPWTLFRLIDQGTLVRINDTTFELRLQSGEHYAVLQISTVSSSNPLNLITDRFLYRFTCNR